MSEFIKDVSELFTETLDKAYLEYSNLTTAKTRNELELEKEIQKLQAAYDVLLEACEFVNDTAPGGYGYNSVETRMVLKAREAI